MTGFVERCGEPDEWDTGCIASAQDLARHHGTRVGSWIACICVGDHKRDRHRDRQLETICASERLTLQIPHGAVETRWHTLRSTSRMFHQLATEWRALRADTPGERFRHHYERSRKHSHARRILGAVAGIALVAAGLIMLVIPGPGILTAIFGLALLSSQSRWLASKMDRAEPVVRRRASELRRRAGRLFGRFRSSRPPRAKR